MSAFQSPNPHEKSDSMKYRKKPIVIEAVQYPVNEIPDNPLEFREVPDWLKEAVDQGKIVPVQSTEDYYYLDITTPEGVMRMGPEDWIIQGVKGEIYPCKKEIFKLTYEAV